MGAPTELEYLPVIQEARGDPQRLEALYQRARNTGGEARFRAALDTTYREAPENLLLGAWHYRLQGALPEARTRTAEWRLAVPISIVLGLAYWALSDPAWTVTSDHIPLLALLWAPLAALAIAWYLTLVTRQHIMRAALVSVGFVAVTAYVLGIAQYAAGGATTYLTLMALHVPLLAACGLGLVVLGWGSAADQRFALLSKAIEVIATAGVAAIAGGIFVGLTVGLFSAIGVTIPPLYMRLLVGGGAGLIAVLSVAAVYDPHIAPLAQEFRRGFMRLLTILMRALLLPTLIVLVIYLAVIPFNFTQPFVNRDVLIVFNALLFAVAALLVGVIPVSAEDVAPQLARWLRLGIAALAALVVLVSVYALSAVLFRTINGHALTLNRTVVIGWNVVNIVLLVLLFIGQVRPAGDWVARAHRTVRLGTAAYLTWALLVALALPWLLQL